MECSICCDSFTINNHKITCPNIACNFISCKSCTRKYFLTSNKDPSCMNCNIIWNQEFIIKNLNKTFINNEYKKHRTKYLTDIEISKIPETVSYAENLKFLNDLENDRKNIKSKIMIISNELAILKSEDNAIRNEIKLIKSGEIINKKKFIMPCQSNNCKGYLSPQYKCNLCNLYTCNKCFEIIGNNKNDFHQCNDNNIKNAEEIKKTTKPCPNCAQRIFKINGCDQMWCTECKVAFSWNTGNIENKVIHNPHYFQYIRENNVNEDLIRNVNDIHCGGLVDFRYVNNNILHPCLNSNDKELINISNKISNLYQTLSHITYFDIPNIRQTINNLSDLKELRAKYILNQLDINEFSKNIYYSDKKRRENLEILYIYELISNYGIELFNNLRNKFNFYRKLETSSFKIYIINIFNKLDNLFEYCNNQFAIISYTFNITIHYINNNYQRISKKYKSYDNINFN